MATVEFQNPLGGVIQEITVVGNGHHGAGEAVQKLLQPLDGLCVQVVGGLVEQQHVGLGQQQPAQRDAALLAARQRADLGVKLGREASQLGPCPRHGLLGRRQEDRGARPERLELQSLAGTLAQTTFYEPPMTLLQQALRLVSTPVRRPTWLSRAADMVATVLFDSLATPAPMGLRRSVFWVIQATRAPCR